MPDDKALQIFIFQAGEFVGSEIFQQRRIEVGRDSDKVDLVLMSGHVSRTHAVIEHNGEQVSITDAGSKNGIFVNDHPTKHSEVRSMDKVTVGDFALKIKLIVQQQQRSHVARKAPAPEVPKSLATVEGSFSDEITPPSLSTAVLDAQYGSSPQDAASMPPVVIDPQPLKNNKTGSQRLRQPPTGAVQLGARDGQLHKTAFADSDHDDHDDEDETFVPPYSLAQTLLQSNQDTITDPAGREALLEIIAVRDDRLLDYAVLVPGGSGWDTAPSLARDNVIGGLQAVTYRADGKAILTCSQGLDGVMVRSGTQHNAAGFFTQDTGHRYVATMQCGDAMHLSYERSTYHLRFVRVPTIAPDTRSRWQKISLEGTLSRVALASVLAHLILVLGFSFITPSEAPPQQPTQEFVVTQKKEPELEEPHKPPPPPPPEKPKAPPKPKPPELHKAPPKKVVHKVAKVAPVAPKPVPRPDPAPAPIAPPAPKAPPAPVPPTPPGILGVLKRKGITQAPGQAAAVQAVSNLSAVKVPGNGGSFRVSGLIGRVATPNVVSIGGGGGALVTKGGASVLRGGAGRLAQAGSQQVTGMVQRVGRAMETHGGSLDRAQIERVVAEHSDELQRCYEKELLHESNLQGKVQVEWVISMSGSVQSVRQMQSTLRSAAVIGCIMNSIRTWKFPHPNGGPVVVNYPFIFKGTDF